jgi:hypothetical protein
MQQPKWESGAQEALYVAGAIRPCPCHFDIFVRTRDRDAERAAFAIRTNMLKRSGDMRWRTEFIGELVDELERIDDACFICEAAGQGD